MQQRKTLYDKIVAAHCVHSFDDEGRELLLYVDRTVLNEYTSPQAFAALRQAGREVWRPSAALGVVDHVNPTAPHRVREMADAGGERQVAFFAENCRDFAIQLFDILHPMQGIEHVVMPEIGRVMPGMVIAAGDSHTTTYGAFGALGFGIGTSDIEHYLATQTVIYRRLKSMRVDVEGDLPLGVTPKDVVMSLIRQIGASGATGYAIEFCGKAIDEMSIEGRMTICNMAVECGARGALVAPDAKVFDYLESRVGLDGDLWARAHRQRRALNQAATVTRSGSAGAPHTAAAHGRRARSPRTCTAPCPVKRRRAGADAPPLKATMTGAESDPRRAALRTCTASRLCVTTQT